MQYDNLKIGFLGVVTTLIGGWDLTLQVLLILMVVDIVTGLLKALQKGDFTSKEFRQGLFNKAGFIVVLILCYQLDTLMLNDQPVIRTIGAIFYIGVEGSSIIENLGQMGVPIPKFIAEKLKRLKDLTDEGELPAVEKEDKNENNIEDKK